MAAVTVTEKFGPRGRGHRRQRTGSPFDINLTGTWRGYGLLLGYYIIKYIDYGEFEATETSSGKVYTLRPTGKIDIFIGTPEGQSLKGSMYWDSVPSVTEIQGDGFTLKKE